MTARMVPMAFCALLAASPVGAVGGDDDLAEARAAYDRADYGIAAVKLRELGAFRENAEAQFLAGEMARRGLGQTPDPIEAQRWYRRAAENGHGEAQLAYARSLEAATPPDHLEALKWYRKSFDQNIVISGYYIGLIYESGLGLPADPARARDWYRKAGDAGSGDALYRLAEMAHDGIATQQDFGEALALTKRAAERGHSRAQAALARMYLSGFAGRPALARDPVKAYVWANIAAASGLDDAAKLRDFIRATLTAAEVAAAQQLAAPSKPH